MCSKGEEGTPSDEGGRYLIDLIDHLQVICQGQIEPLSRELSSLMLDGVDKKILSILQEDARKPYTELAKAVGMGETTVRYRIGRLVRERVITKFTTLLNPKMVGFTLAAIVLVKIEPRFLRKVFDIMASYDEAFHIIQTTGEYDLVTVVHAKDMAHLNELSARIRGIRGVKEAEVWIATGLLKIDPTFKLD